tara:strand:+ start:75 stop:257 length:183 start_codon:yes stop_codon:yes gene_type:complete
MDTDDLEPQTPRPVALDFEVMSVEQLEEHIAALQAEIERARAAISAKTSARGKAEAVFKI